MSRDYWQTKRLVVETRKNKKKLTFPAFSANAFYQRDSLEATSSTIDAVNLENNPSVGRSLATAFTMECMFKSYTTDSVERCLLSNVMINDTLNQVAIFLYEGKFLIKLRKTGAYVIFNSTNNIPVGEWTHVCLTYDGTTASLYINGILDSTQAVAAPLDPATGAVYGLACCSALPFASFFIGLVAEARIWTAARTALEVFSYYNRPVARTATNLVIWHRFTNLRDISGLIVAYEQVLQQDISIGDSLAGFRVESEDLAPIILGASYVVLQSTVNLAYPVSISYPVTPPSNNNFGLFVSWTDEENVFQRKQLFSADGIVIAPVPEEYAGEKIISPFKLEIWNIDGEETVDLEEDFDILISKTSHPTSNTDHSNVEEAAITLDTTLAENFPLTSFPLEFNTQQNWS